MKLVKPNQLDKSNPGTWPIYYQVIVWILMVGLIWFIYNRFIREELLTTQSNNQNEIVKLQESYKTLYQFSLDLPLYEARKVELRGKLKALLKFLPAETEMPNLIDDIYKAAYENEINFSRFTPGASVVKDYYNIEPISLSTETGFNNFAQFVQNIGELPRILNVRSFNIDSQNPDVLSITSDLETYIYNQDVQKYLGEQNGVAK